MPGGVSPNDAYPLYDFEIAIAASHYDENGRHLNTYAPLSCTLYGPEEFSGAGELYQDLPDEANDLEIQCATEAGKSIRLQNVKRSDWFYKSSYSIDYFIFKWPVAVIRHVNFEPSFEEFSELIQLASQDRIILKEYAPANVKRGLFNFLPAFYNHGTSTERFSAEGTHSFALFHEADAGKFLEKMVWIDFRRTSVFKGRRLTYPVSRHKRRSHFWRFAR